MAAGGARPDALAGTDAAGPARRAIGALELPDGDFVRLDWVGSGGPTVIVLPGLQGDLKSAYVRGLLRACQTRGWRGVLLNYRGRVEPNRLRQSYHCGMTCDLDYLVHRLAEREPLMPIAVVGFSVGANICLRWLGECGQRGQALPVAAAVGVSAPFNLGAVAKKIERGFSRIYQWYLLRSLRRDVVRKMEALGDDLGLSHREIRRPEHVLQVRRPHQRALERVRRRRGLLRQDAIGRALEARGGADTHPQRRQRPAGAAPPDPAAARRLRQGDAGDSRGGGHLGFVGGRWPWSPRFWLDTRIPEFFLPFFAGNKGRQSTCSLSSGGFGVR